jgi:phage shock protein C
MRNDIKRLYRVPADGRIAGLCAGLGDYFRLDPVFFRLAWVAVTVMTGVVPGTVAYLIAWLLVPREPLPAAAKQVERLDRTHA